MSDMALNFVFLILSLILAAIGAAVAAWLQHRSWVNQNWEQLRSERSKAALATVQRTSELIDRRLHSQRRLLWALREGERRKIEDRRNDYVAVIQEWMGSLGRTKAELWNAFGKYAAIDFERDIHDAFARNGRALEARIKSKERGGLHKEESDLNELGRSSYEKIQTLLERIDSGNLNGLQGRERLAIDNWDNLSSIQLYKRLFGLRPDL